MKETIRRKFNCGHVGEWSLKDGRYRKLQLYANFPLVAKKLNCSCPKCKGDRNE